MSSEPADVGRIASLPRLVGLTGGLTGRSIFLEKQQILVGRESTCDLVLNHALVSRKHALLKVDANGSFTLTDLGSRTGTFVNDVRIDRLELADGDRVGFGAQGLIAFTYHARGRVGHAPSVCDRGAPVVEELRARLRTAGETAARQPATSPQAASAGLGATPATPRPAETGRSERKIGRAPDNDLVLDSPSVSRHHACIRYDSNWSATLVDLGSSNGTFVNGVPVLQPQKVNPTDLVFLGGYLLRIDGQTVTTHDLASSRLIAVDLCKDFGERTVLRDISFAILPREFVGLIGPSGCGKSTLMDALNGLRPATRGNVFIDDLDLYHNFDAVRRSIGYVPQRDILHEGLTVERTLQYAARLRLPERTNPEEMARTIEEVIDIVELREHRQTAFQQLSGGQQKRLSLALELLTKPSFLFLDEPTSPLDPETSETLMLLFRRLADEGRIVVMVTHKFEKFKEMHQIALLTKGGRLAFFGPPQEALSYFHCAEPAHIYRRIAEKEPEAVAREFRDSAHYQTLVASRLAESNEALAVARTAGALLTADARTPHTQFGLRQWRILTQRYLEVKLKDRRNTTLLVAQSPIIALLLAVIAGDVVSDARTLFIASVIAIWFGANNAIREIVAEVPIYRRERLVNLKIPSYLFSKFAVLGGIAVLQCTLLVAILAATAKLRLADFGPILVTLCVTSFGGVAMALLASAFVNTTDKAMTLLPLILIPQLLLSGFLKPIDDVYVNLRTGKPATAAQYEDFQHAKEPASGVQVMDPIQKTGGLGSGAYVASMMIARWSLDGLVHATGRYDAITRDRLAAQLFVAAYDDVRRGRPEHDIADSYGWRIAVDWLVMSVGVFVCLGLGAAALRSKDSL